MRKVLLLTRAMIPSAVLCGDAPLKELARQGKIVYRCSSPGKLRREDLAWADAVIFIRPDSPWETIVARMARRAGKLTACVLDDDLLGVPPGLSSAAHYRRARTREAIRQAMDACRVLVTPSPELLERYGASFERTVLIREPAMGTPPAEKASGEGITVGFAGSVDRTGDLDAIVDAALRRVLHRHPNTVRAEFFGACPALAREGLVRHIPCAPSYGEYRRVMAALDWDIALAPLPDTPFHRCKYANKFVEYASFGLAGIYSDGPVYRRAVRHGETGLLVPNTPAAWELALEKLIADEPLRRRLAAGAGEEARTTYALPAVAADWERVWGALPPEPGEKRPLALFAFRRTAAGAEALLARAEKHLGRTE